MGMAVNNIRRVSTTYRGEWFDFSNFLFIISRLWIGKQTVVL